MLSETEILVRDTLAAKPYYKPVMGPVLVGVLQRHCVSHEHRIRVCARAMEMKFGPEEKSEDRCPGPAELAELCEQVSAGAKKREASPDCEFCRGEGYESGDNGARRCRCGGLPMSDDSRAGVVATGGRKAMFAGVDGVEVSADREMSVLVGLLAGRKAL